MMKLKVSQILNTSAPKFLTMGTTKAVKRWLTVATQRLNCKKSMWHNTSQQINVQTLRHPSFLMSQADVNHGPFGKTLKKIGAIEFICYLQVLRIPWAKMVKNADILQDLNIRENWFTNSVWCVSRCASVYVQSATPQYLTFFYVFQSIIPQCLIFFFVYV